DNALFHEGAVLPEYLDAVVAAVADIDEIVAADSHTVNRIELLGLGTVRGVLERHVVVRTRTVRAPMTSVRAGLAVEYDDPAIAITVRYEPLIGLRIHHDAGRTAEILRIVAPVVLAALADLQEKAPASRELQDVCSGWSVAA